MSLFVISSNNTEVIGVSRNSRTFCLRITFLPGVDVPVWEGMGVITPPTPTATPVPPSVAGSLLSSAEYTFPLSLTCSSSLSTTPYILFNI